MIPLISMIFYVVFSTQGNFNQAFLTLEGREAKFFREGGAFTQELAEIDWIRKNAAVSAPTTRKVEASSETFSLHPKESTKDSVSEVQNVKSEDKESVKVSEKRSEIDLIEVNEGKAKSKDEDIKMEANPASDASEFESMRLMENNSVEGRQEDAKQKQNEGDVLSEVKSEEKDPKTTKRKRSCFPCAQRAAKLSEKKQ